MDRLNGTTVSSRELDVPMLQRAPKKPKRECLVPGMFLITVREVKDDDTPQQKQIEKKDKGTDINA